MFIRKKRNRSGSVSVVVVDKADGRFKELVTIGVSTDSKEIDRLVTEGREWIYRGWRAPAELRPLWRGAGSPASKAATAEYLRGCFDDDVSLWQIYRYLDRLGSNAQSKVQDISVKHTLDVHGGTVGVVFYDVTTLYFEADREDDLRRTGFSKEGRHRNHKDREHYGQTCHPVNGEGGGQDIGD